MMSQREFEQLMAQIDGWRARADELESARQAVAAETGQAAAGPPGGPTILLVDDDDDTRLVCLEILQAAGYHVLEARDGNEALLVVDWHEGPIDLVITDVVMPYVDGHEFARRLQPLRQGTRILYISGYVSDTLPEPGPDGAIHFLAKPFTPETLERKVRQMLAPPPEA